MNLNVSQVSCRNAASGQIRRGTKLTTLMVLLVLACVPDITHAQTVIGGTTAPDESAILDIRSTEKGVLFPRLSETERDAVQNPAEGLLIFNTTSSCLEMNAGTTASPAWTEIICRQPFVDSLGCSQVTVSAFLAPDNPIEEIGDPFLSIPYYGGNGVGVPSQSINSTGVTGLTATMEAFSLEEGDSTIVLSLSGTFTETGTASFLLEVAQQSCQIDIQVPNLHPNYCDPSSPTLIVDVTNPATGKTWMDRNLGASRVATSATDAQARGNLFQWGRASDGHECRNSSSTTTLATTAVPDAGNSWDGRFIKNISPYNWLNPQSTVLWQGVNGTNNPCPSGYRLPTKAEWEEEIQSWDSANLSGAFGSPLKLPAVGIRDANFGTVVLADSRAWYWSSGTEAGPSYNHLSVDTGNASVSTFNSGTGMAIRCIKD